MRSKLEVALGSALAVLALSRPVFSLDKQGSAHGGQLAGGAQQFNVSGSVMLGASLYNPTYAARPDNTGRALFRYALHLDVDLLGRYLSIPIDVNLFTDRRRSGAGIFAGRGEPGDQVELGRSRCGSVVWQSDSTPRSSPTSAPRT